MQRTSFFRAILATCSALLSAQCTALSGPDCIDETRGITVTARLSGTGSPSMPADTGSVFLGLMESRNHDSKRTSYRNVNWLVGTGVPRSTVTAVHFHDKASGNIVFTVPVDSAFWPPYIVTRAIEPVAYTGALEWNSFYDLLGNGSVYVDVHTPAAAGGRLQGDLGSMYPDWREFKHSYCS